MLGKLDKRKYPEYNLGNTRTAKLIIVFEFQNLKCKKTSMGNITTT